MIRKSGFRFSEKIMLKELSQSAMTADPYHRALGRAAF
jgi:hypothetical protein